VRDDRQRHDSKSGLSAWINGFRGGILRWSLRAAADQRKQRAGRQSYSPASRSSTAVSPFELGAIRACRSWPG
jgi:hypothetical protein